MSTERNTPKTQTPAGRKPDLVGYSVKQGADAATSHWSKIGAAWAHKDGLGFDVRMDALPVDGRLVLREPPAEDSVADGPS